MDILDKLAQELFAALAHGSEAGVDISTSAAEALAEYERVRGRTVVLTFEKAKDVADGRHAVLFTYEGECVKDAMLAVCGGVHLEDGDFASCPLPKLPGPEVFGKETP